MESSVMVCITLSEVIACTHQEHWKETGEFSLFLDWISEDVRSGTAEAIFCLWWETGVSMKAGGDQEEMQPWREQKREYRKERKPQRREGQRESQPSPKYLS